MEQDLRGALSSGRLQYVVRAALGESSAVLESWDAQPLGGGSRSLGDRGLLYLIQGTARVGAAESSWRLVLQILVPNADQNDPTGSSYWKREGLLHGSGILENLPGGLKAPRCYGREEQPDGSIWLWLEHVQEDGERVWPIARWVLAARHLGQFNGAYLTTRPLPEDPGLGGQRLRAWLGRHGPLVARIAAAPNNPAVARWWPQPVVDAILHLWGEREVFCDALERLPQTFCHGDAIRRNLYARRAADGSEETVAIDWEHAGLSAPGEEVGQTLSVASAFYDLEPADLPALDEALFAGYLAGLQDAGWRGDPRPVRFAYAAHAALRNAFNAVGATLPDEAGRARAPKTFGHTFEELAERRAEIRPFLLERAEEARGLLESV